MTLYYTILYYTILYYTILYYTILYYTILYYTILYYTILYYTIRTWWSPRSSTSTPDGTSYATSSPTREESSRAHLCFQPFPKKVHLTLTPGLHNLILCRPIHRQMSDGLTLEQICQMTDPRGSMTSTLLCAAFTAFL